MDAFGLDPQYSLSPSPASLLFSNHLYLIDDSHIVLIIEWGGFNGAADHIQILKIFLLASDERAVL